MSYCSGTAEKLTKEEFSALLPQRNKIKDVVDHFPNQPELPDSMTSTDVFYLISNANDSYDEEIMANDVLGLPLGAQESDFSKVTDSPDDESDAVVIQAGGTAFTTVQQLTLMQYGSLICTRKF